VKNQEQTLGDILFIERMIYLVNCRRPVVHHPGRRNVAPGMCQHPDKDPIIRSQRELSKDPAQRHAPFAI